ncbi:hypothetical protein A7U60_g1926 [Sanghuangporus baumii]|uniref:Uncharacterized protein n=1 Tax=Sanghuangporus baumii TaxID=108892 RepID=A0A9Q5I436_SANBA|nr:hypothetical protein A7U60_g1926 [Sanghuangporus baumii]
MSVRLVVPHDAPAEVHRRSQPIRISTVRDWVDYHASRFLLKNYNRLLGRTPECFVSPKELMRRRIIKEIFDELHAVYTARVEELIRNKERIDHLRRCITALCIRNAWKRSVLANLHMMEDVVRELDEREAEEQEILEGIREVALEILSLD